jgi:hypothetical protein
MNILDHTSIIFVIYNNIYNIIKDAWYRFYSSTASIFWMKIEVVTP